MTLRRLEVEEEAEVVDEEFVTSPDSTERLYCVESETVARLEHSW